MIASNEYDIADRLNLIHQEMLEHHHMLCRIAISILDPKTQILKTFAQSSEIQSSITFYNSPLKNAKSLVEIAETNKVRVIDDLAALNSSSVHTQKLVSAGYQSSLTYPIIFKGDLYGFLFFNSREKDYFCKSRVAAIKSYAAEIKLFVVNEMHHLKTFKGAINTAREFSRHRDEETATHLERMSRFSRLIALQLTPKKGKSDEWVEYIFQFAPLHDVGKVAIADSILLKPGKLTDNEYGAMKLHVNKGDDIIVMMQEQFGLNSLTHFEMLKNIVLYHHEAFNGSGYPNGLAGDDIPLEARIICVADVFDALTSIRPYKDKWSNDLAFKMIEENAGILFDPDCVEALSNQKQAVEKIQEEFAEDHFG